MLDFSFFFIGVDLFLRLLVWLIIGRIILSWVAPGAQGPVARFLTDVTEPVLGFIRNRLPRGNGAMAMMDFSPLIAVIAIDILRGFLMQMF